MPDSTQRNMKMPDLIARMTLASGMLFMLAGCADMSGIAPHAQSSDADEFDAGKAISCAPLISWPSEAWWAVYRDPQLDALITKTIDESPTFRAAQTRIAQSQAASDSLYAETLPNISADTSIAREKFTSLQFIPPPWGGNTDWNNKTQLTLAYDLDLWDRQKSLWRASVDESRAIAAEVQLVKLALVTAVIQSYVQLAMEFKLRDIAVAQMQQLELRVSIARRSLAAGLGTELAVAEIETPLPQARAQIEAIDARMRLLRNQLAALSGQGPGAGEHLARPTLALDAVVGLPDRLPANLVGRRPDVLASIWRVQAAQQNIEGARAAFYPNINLLAFAGFQAIGFGQLATSAATIAGVGPAISLPIFDGGRRRGNLSAKTAAYDNAVESYNGLLVRALQEVSDQLVVLQANARQQTEAENALGLARKTHALAVKSFHAGLDDYQHVLKAMMLVLQQQENMARLQAVRLAAYANLMRALGGGTLTNNQMRQASVY